MNFSFILATRGRLELFKSFLDSLRLHTTHRDKIEVLVVGQTDDRIMVDRLPGLKEAYCDINLDYWILPWVENYCPTYKKFCSLLARGDYIIAVDDEHLYKTPGWDTILLQRFEHFLKDKPDKVLYCRLDSKHWKPILSKKALELLDYEYYDMRYYGWGSDINLYVIFRDMPQKWSRICDVAEVEVVHRSYHHGRRQKDATSLIVERINHAHPIGGGDNPITSKRRKKVYDYIVNACEGSGE